MKKVWKWLDNFWYHHKWKTIIIAAFAFMFITLGTQFAGKSNPDIKILYAGPLYFTPNQSQAVSLCLYDLMDDYGLMDEDIEYSFDNMQEEDLDE